jgi:hypothetical protein
MHVADVLESMAETARVGGGPELLLGQHNDVAGPRVISVTIPPGTAPD